MKKIFPTLMLACLMALSLHAQIDSLKIIPNSPTSDDTVKVIAFTTHGSVPCFLTTSTVNLVDETIVVQAWHFRGPWTLVCYSIDTLEFGMLEPGNYELHYQLFDTTSTEPYAIDTISFTVHEVIGIRHTASRQPEISVYPIPAGNELTLKLPFPNTGYFIEFYTHLGNRIKSVYTGKETVNIRLNNIPDGMYYAVITDKYGRRWTKKIIKGSP